jgi:hypothetical protein
MDDERVIELWITAPRGGTFGVSGYPMVVRRFADLVAAETREECAKYLRDVAARLAPEGKRTNQVDRHTAHVLACKGDELAAGYASRDVGEKVSDKEIERLVRKAGLLELIDDACLNDACTSICDWLPALHEFAELVQSAEHERCASVCDALAEDHDDPGQSDSRARELLHEKAETARVLAARIRAA